MAFDKMEKYYAESYSAAQRSGLQGCGNRIIDRLVAYRVGNLDHLAVLEIGSSSGEHFDLSYKSMAPSLYVGIDLLPGSTNSGLLEGIRSKSNPYHVVCGSAETLPFAESTFDLVISTCVLAHVDSPEKVLSELRRVTKDGGRVVIGMPTDPGLLNRLIKVLVTYRSMRRSGVNNPRYSYAVGHKNAIGNLLVLCRHVFVEDRTRFYFFPFLFKSWNFNLAVTFETKVTKRRS